MWTAIGAGVSALGSLASQGVNSWIGRQNQKASLSSQYHYAKRYAINSPSWNVEGLRKAGLNPVLASGSGFSASSWSPNSSVQQSSTTWDPNILQMRNFAKQNQLLDEQIEGQKISNENSRKNMGLSGRDATYARIFNEVREAIGEDAFKKLPKATLEGIKSLFDNPSNFPSFSPRIDLRTDSTPNKPLLSEDTPPSMATHFLDVPRYYDSRRRPSRLESMYRERQREIKRETRSNQHRLREFLERVPNLKKFLYR